MYYNAEAFMHTVLFPHLFSCFDEKYQSFRVKSYLFFGTYGHGIERMVLNGARIITPLLHYPPHASTHESKYLLFLYKTICVINTLELAD